MSTGEVSGPPPENVPNVELGPIGPKARYEFTPVQESIIGDLAGKMRFVGIFLVVFAVFWIVQGILVVVRSKGTLFDIYGAINALLFGLIGYWTVSASSAFTAVIQTTGWDVPHLMDALRSLRKMYTLLFGLLIALFVASFVLMVAYRVR